MDNKYLILSDIHGNLSAFEAVLNDCSEDSFSGVILLGDCIDYGMRSNEVIDRIIALKHTIWKDKVITDIWGNHEKLAIDNDLEKLSTDRGRIIARYTKDNLTDRSLDYIRHSMIRDGRQDFYIDGCRCLAVHGSLDNCYWKSIAPDQLRGDYGEYDIVFSGHSHYSHCFTHFYPTDNAELRNKKAVLFINPGSVGQPRNQNPLAQYAVICLPSRRIEMRAVEYDIELEQSLFPDIIDEFYKSRLKTGI